MLKRPLFFLFLSSFRVPQLDRGLLRDDPEGGTSVNLSVFLNSSKKLTLRTLSSPPSQHTAASAV